MLQSSTILGNQKYVQDKFMESYMILKEKDRKYSYCTRNLSILYFDNSITNNVYFFSNHAL